MPAAAAAAVTSEGPLLITAGRAPPECNIIVISSKGQASAAHSIRWRHNVGHQPPASIYSSSARWLARTDGAAAAATAATRLLFISIYDAGEKNKAVVDGSSSSLAASAQ